MKGQCSQLVCGLWLVVIGLGLFSLHCSSSASGFLWAENGGQIWGKKRPPEGGQNVLGRYETEYL